MQRIVYYIGSAVAIFIAGGEIYRVARDVFEGITTRLRAARKDMLPNGRIAFVRFAAGYAYTFHHMLLDQGLCGGISLCARITDVVDPHEL